jgi:hypothetical protein
MVYKMAPPASRYSVHPSLPCQASTWCHLLLRVVEELLLTVGGTVGYFCGDMRRVMDDVASFHPTVFCGVPRVLDRVYTGVTDKVGDGRLARNRGKGQRLHVGSAV